tara:strand:- start:94 stop:876 length:783 start_codon:yes stop_codon:yes gene_type:complete
MTNEINKLIQIMGQLRDPINGCSWDKEQNFKSIAPHTIEEAYEVANAIENNDFDNLKEELGDLLLQVIFHSQMASEIKMFDFQDVVKSIIAKLIRRHPHIFNIKNKLTSNEVSNQWEKIKQFEQKKNNINQLLNFDSIPNNFPSTLKALKIQKKAASFGFDWENIDDAINKIDEEYNEFKKAIEIKNRKSQIDEMGDLLFSCINVCRKLNINFDESLQMTNKKFVKRYNKAENLALDDKKVFENLSLSEKEFYWQKAKVN